MIRDSERGTSTGPVHVLWQTNLSVGHQVISTHLTDIALTEFFRFTRTCPVLRYAGAALLFFVLTDCADYRLHQDEPGELTFDEPPTGTIEYSTFLVGDLGYDYKRGLTTLETMIAAMPPGKKKSSLLLLGDITGKDGLRKKNGPERAHLDALGARLGQVPGSVFYTPGENELGRESNFGRLDRLEDYFRDNVDKKVRFMPNRQCSGPDDEELHEGIGLIGINTAWYLADWRRDKEVSEGCDYTNRNEMTFALADEIKGYRDQVKIVMMHHPMESFGNRGGEYSLAQHLLPLPLLGTVVRGIQSVSGGPNDVSNLLYQQMQGKIKFGIDDEVNVIFVSGHEHNMTLIHEGEYMQLIAGSGSTRGPARGGNDANFNYGAVGYSRLDFYDSGQVYVGFYTVDADGGEERVFYRRIIDDRNARQDVGVEEVPTEAVTERSVRTTVYGGNAGAKKGLARGALGRHYRSLYSLPVELPVLRIDTFAGGLMPYRRGGGQTTMSLHTEGGDGHLYQLRSVRKNPAQLLPSLLERSFAADLTKDVFTAIHPFAPLALPPWQRKLGLYGADPYLYYIPKQEGLGDYNTNFGGEMYWVEQRPDEDWSGTRFFGGSKDIISNSDMREESGESWKHYADDKNYARARLFDFWIGDWDRHRDQWRWAAFEEDDGRTRYVPVARDRDQVFSNYDGGLLGAARVFVAEARKLRPFTGQLDKAKWRAMNGKWNDRRFLNQLTKEEMLAEARFIQQTITEQDIDEALQRLPAEAHQHSLEQENINGKLKQRLTQLEDFAEEYYLDLAEAVNVLGTGKDDVLRATGLANGDLHVRVYDADKEGEADELYYDRVFHAAETNEVVVYGMDGDDRFELRGERSKIRLRVIGGTDGDVVHARGNLRAFAYDEKGGMKFKGDAEGNIKDRRSDNYPELNQYNFEEYYPDYTTPIPVVGFNVDDGLLAGAGFTRVNHGFRPDPYANRHTLLASYSTNDFYKVSYAGQFNHVFSRRKDLTFNGHYFSTGYVTNFFGIGNDAPPQPEDGEIEGLADDDVLEYNRARRGEIALNPMVRFRGQRNRTNFSIGPFFERYDLDDDIPAFALINNTDSRFITDRIFDRQSFAGLRARFVSNNVAVPLLADSGVKYELYGQQSWNLDEDRATTKFGGQFTVYKMLTKAINFATRISVEHNDGSPEYYQLASMGGRTTYRAARSERYRGNTMFVQNLDLRFMGFGFGGDDVPTVGGFIVGLDYGRVWLDGEDSDTWHVGYGGGVWLAPLGATIISLTYFRDKDDARVAFAAGWPF